MIRVVADDRIPFLRGALETVARIDYLPGHAITRQDLMQADALLIRTRTRCNRELLEGTGVRFIASATIGHDHIDSGFCISEGIRWTNAPGCNAGSVRQYIVSTLLHLATSMHLDLNELNLGVVGVGNVGRLVADAAETLGLHVLKNDPPRQRKEGPEGFVSLDELLAESDIVSLHVPLNRGGTDQTYHLVDEEFLEKARKGCMLINTSRGPVVDSSALRAAISRDRISAAVLDVFEHEPDIDRELIDDLAIATPHIAGYSADGKANGTKAAVRSLSRFFGLGLDTWSPAHLPEPVSGELFGDASLESSTGLIWEIYRQTYDVTGDDSRLRSDPDSFDKWRAEYPLRREPEAYSVRLFQGYPEIVRILENLGFSVLQDHCA